MGSTPRGIPFPDPSTPPRRQAFEDLALGADAAIGTALGGAWQAYTPSWTATTTNPNIGNGTITGNYQQYGKTIAFRIGVIMGSTTTYGSGQYVLSLPVATAAPMRWHFTGILRDVSTGALATMNTAASGATLGLFCDPTTAGGGLRVVSPTSPFTFASGDEIWLNGVYEAA